MQVINFGNFMITIISPEAFKKIPWKNGLGFTTELAINDGATLDNFDWRLSIASVTSNGEFSNFSGYDRNLVLIEGHSIALEHGSKYIDNLTTLLDIAKFDGGCKTIGTLKNGPINDFNVITNQSTTKVQVNTYTASQEVTVSLPVSGLLFAYSLSQEISMTCVEQQANSAQSTTLTQGSLMKIAYNVNSTNNFTISGENMIIVQIDKKLTHK